MSNIPITLYWTATQTQKCKLPCTACTAFQGNIVEETCCGNLVSLMFPRLRAHAAVVFPRNKKYFWTFSETFCFPTNVSCACERGSVVAKTFHAMFLQQCLLVCKGLDHCNWVVAAITWKPGNTNVRILSDRSNGANLVRLKFITLTKTKHSEFSNFINQRSLWLKLEWKWPSQNKPFRHVNPTLLLSFANASITFFHICLFRTVILLPTEYFAIFPFFSYLYCL